MKQKANISKRLLKWYDDHARDLPWRVREGKADPYAVWLSEIMLQQTTVATVGPYYQKFIQQWPTVNKLAVAELDDVLRAWAGLGYYSRARNLHKCAKAIVEAHGGKFPETEEGLLSLPGIGPYTAAAIGAIAFDLPTNVVDGNVERVMARFFAVEEPLPTAKTALKSHAEMLVTETRPGDYAQALMDLGATICTPRKPSCLLCPIRSDCLAHKKGNAEELPKRAPKKEKPTRRAVMFWLQKKDGSVFVRRRAEKGLLGGMMEIPSSPWVENGQHGEELTIHAPTKAKWKRQEGMVRHTFTHFHLELEVFTATTTKGLKKEGEWVPLEELEELALPTVMKKVAKHAREALAL